MSQVVGKGEGFELPELLLFEGFMKSLELLGLAFFVFEQQRFVLKFDKNII